MQVIEGISRLSGSQGTEVPFQSSVLTIGNFDGVHLGHRALISRVVEKARAEHVPAIVMTFEPHPVKVLYPDRKLHRIFDFEDQRVQLKRLGVDALVVEPFSREFSQLPPDRYLREWILEPFNPVALIVGHDFSFGANRKGSIDFLKEQAGPAGFTVEVVAPVKVGDTIVSSSRIRKALEEGDVVFAHELLGRPFYLEGIVEKGAGRGRTIGIPTANLFSSAETIPSRGVYCGWAYVRGTRYRALINIGLNPTFTGGGAGTPLTVEAHLPDFGIPSSNFPEFYGESMKLEFVGRLRDERKFGSAAELVAQIRADIEAGKRILDAIG